MTDKEDCAACGKPLNHPRYGLRAYHEDGTPACYVPVPHLEQLNDPNTKKREGRLLYRVDNHATEEGKQECFAVGGNCRSHHSALYEALKPFAAQQVRHFEQGHTEAPNNCPECGPILRAKAALDLANSMRQRGTQTMAGVNK